jgi:hypothetical protein
MEARVHPKKPGLRPNAAFSDVAGGCGNQEIWNGKQSEELNLELRNSGTAFGVTRVQFRLILRFSI